MALNKERKVLLGLLGSAGLILAADQFLLGSPQGANASQAAPAAQPLPTPQASAGGTAAQQPIEPALLLASGELVDTWNARLSEATPENPPASGIADPFSAVQQHEPDSAGVPTPQMFQQQHELSAVMTGGDMGVAMGVAMVNKKPIRVGQAVAGYRLISVDARSAVFQAGDTTVRLTLPKQGAGGS